LGAQGAAANNEWLRDLVMNAPFFATPPDAPQMVLFTLCMCQLIADAIESLILLLDVIDGDADLEENDPAIDSGDAELSHGPFELMNQAAAWRANDSGGGGADLELDADTDPSIAASECHPCSAWAC
jgi:hypothetical protein